MAQNQNMRVSAALEIVEAFAIEPQPYRVYCSRMKRTQEKSVLQGICQHE